MRLGHNEICRLLDIAPGTASTYLKTGKPVPSRDGSREFDLAELRKDDGTYEVPQGHTLFEELFSRRDEGGSGSEDRERTSHQIHSNRLEDDAERAKLRDNPPPRAARSDDPLRTSAEHELRMQEIELRNARLDNIAQGLEGLGTAIVQNPAVLQGSIQAGRLLVPAVAGLLAGWLVFDEAQTKEEQSRVLPALGTFSAVSLLVDVLLNREQSIVSITVTRWQARASLRREQQESPHLDGPPIRYDISAPSADGLAGSSDQESTESPNAHQEPVDDVSEQVGGSVAHPTDSPDAGNVPTVPRILDFRGLTGTDGGET